MGSVLWLATEASKVASEMAEATEGGGFGFNFNILETNLINLAIVIGVVVYFGRQFLGDVLTSRRTAIEEAIQDAEKRRKEAASALAEQQQKLTQSQTEAQRIRASAEENAKANRAAILAKAAEDVQRLKESAAQDLSAAQERAIAQLRERIANLALTQAESHLRGQLNEETQRQLIDRSITLLGGSR
jgi:F-type H+-transporting ATPase subunit b